MLRKRKNNGSHFSVVTSFLAILLIIISALSYTGIQTYKERLSRLQAESESLTAQENSLTEKLISVRAEKNNTNDSAYVEDIARSQLDMVYPGEIVFKKG